jgi:lipopolysaccharide/colanic/teichoic acid biosynthesis glycosyltransferase
MYHIFKRFFDLLFGVVGLILISPLFGVISLFLKFSGEGDVFYLQERIGKHRKPFSIYKFATMLRNSPNMGNKTVTLRNDPRITLLGKYLRITKINELPQILNVLLGHMSLVGPRPLLPTSFVKYTPEVQDIISQLKPGITGIGSLVFRDEEKLTSAYKQLGKDPLDYYREHIYPYKGALESWYASNKSFLVDFSILVLTFWSIVYPKTQLTHQIFSTLPNKPSSLTLEGIRNL